MFFRYSKATRRCIFWYIRYLRFRWGWRLLPLEFWLTLRLKVWRFVSYDDPLFPPLDAFSRNNLSVRDPDFRAMLPGLRLGIWSLTAEAIEYLTARLASDSPDTVLECGCGVSTLLLGHYARSQGRRHNRTVQIISLEQSHDEKVRIERDLVRFDLSRYVQIVEAPLSPDGRYLFDPSVIHQLLKGRKVDWILIDGPFGPQGCRRFTLPLIAPFCRPGTLWFLDDALRDGELEALGEWAGTPGLVVIGILPLSKGIGSGILTNPSLIEANSIATRSVRFIPRRKSRSSLAHCISSPCYHFVGDQPCAHVRHLYPWRTTQTFEAELDYLLEQFEFLSLDDLFSCVLKGRRPPRRALFLSFDDGFREMSEVVGPICKRKGVPATFFLTTDFLDNRKLGFRHKASVLVDHLSRFSEDCVHQILEELSLRHNLEHSRDANGFLLSVRYNESRILDEVAQMTGLDFEMYLNSQRPYLSSDQVRQLTRDGFAIGAHSLDHPRYSEVPLDEQLRQTQGSVEFLEANFDIRVRAFAFPFVSDGVSDEFYGRVFSERICDIVFCIGQTAPNIDLPVIRRFGVECGTNEPIWTILRDMRNRRRRSRIGRLVSPMRRLLR